jgi:3-dehydroquinate dehydratase/shikimate dehydrogenase
VTITAATTAELRRKRDEAAEADIIELRLDGVRDPDVSGALAGRRRPSIITCRPRWEGGLFDGSEEERRRILHEAVALGSEYVDVEWRAGFEEIIAARNGRGCVVSSHEFDDTPSDLESRVDAMRTLGAEVVKIAALARTMADVVRLRDAGVRASRAGRAVTIAMGPLGLISRVLPDRFGSAWAYAGTLDAIGQISTAELLDEFRFRATGAQTRVFVVVGKPVAHSLSPAMHNAAFGATGRDAVYLPCPADTADDFVAFARAFDVSGASITVPYKVELLDRVDEISGDAREIGAVNTLRVDHGRWVGENTDAIGFLAPVDGCAPLGRMRVSVLGAGGAARAVAFALKDRAAAVSVHARRVGQAREVAARTGAGVGPWPPEPGTWDLLVNCTPIGMTPGADDSPVPSEALTGGWVYDLVYNPPATRLLRDAAAAGCRTITGLDMLVAQAEQQYRCWTGALPPPGIMRRAAERRLGKWNHNENHVV